MFLFLIVVMLIRSFLRETAFMYIYVEVLLIIYLSSLARVLTRQRLVPSSKQLKKIKRLNLG